VSLVAFGLSWLLREQPLRTHAHASDAIPVPGEHDVPAELAAPRSS
jgi:hypothetical protein